jgi:hypothetical protein
VEHLDGILQSVSANVCAVSEGSGKAGTEPRTLNCDISQWRLRRGGR